MSAVKKLIKAGIRMTGWEVTKVDAWGNGITNRPTMIGALERLGSRQIPINTVLDVGASNGCWSVECMRFTNATNYVLFEPQPVHQLELRELKRRSSKNVTLIEKAVGATEGVTYFDAGEPMGGALSNEDGQNMIQVPVTTIDHVAAETELKGPFLLKLDTHGFEPSILAGSENTLRDCSVLIIEAYNFHISQEAVLFWELCAMLSKRGFRCVDLVDILHRQFDSALWQMDLVFIRDTWEGFKRITYA